MKARVAPREPVEPATMTGSLGGSACQRWDSASMTRRCRNSVAGASDAGSIQSAAIPRTASVCAQCADISPVSSLWIALSGTPSPCISSISRARLSVRS